MARRNNKRHRRGLNLLRVNMNGAKHRSRPDPPTFVTIPWNTVTLSFVSDTNGALTYGDLFVGLASQLGVAASAQSVTLQARILSAHVWTQGNGNTINVRFLDLLSPNAGTPNSGYRVLSEQTDADGRNHYANCGFTWPRTQQNYVIDARATDLNNTILTAALQSTASLLVHVRILWRTQSDLAPTERTFIPYLGRGAGWQPAKSPCIDHSSKMEQVGEPVQSDAEAPPA